VRDVVDVGLSHDLSAVVDVQGIDGIPAGGYDLGQRVEAGHLAARVQKSAGAAGIADDLTLVVDGVGHAARWPEQGFLAAPPCRNACWLFLTSAQPTTCPALFNP